MKNFIFLIFVSSLAGCALFAPAEDATAEKFAEAMNRYCALTIETDRLRFREKVNALGQGNVGRIDCAK